MTVADAFGRTVPRSQAGSSRGHHQPRTAIRGLGNERGDLVRFVSHDRPFDTEAHATEALREDRAAAILARAGRDSVADGEHQRGQAVDRLDGACHFLVDRARVDDRAPLVALPSSAGSSVLGGGRFQWPLLPPLFSSSRTPLMVTNRSALLTMS